MRAAAILAAGLAALAVGAAAALALQGPTAPTTTVAAATPQAAGAAAGTPGITWAAYAKREAEREAAIRAAKANAIKERREREARKRAEALKLDPGEKGPRVKALQAKLVGLKMLRSDQADGNYGDATQAAVMAFQKLNDLDRDGIAGAQTQRKIDSSATPEPLAKGADDRVEIDLSKQLLQIIEGGEVVRTISASSGTPGRDTPTGTFHVYLKDPNAYSRKYDAPMPLASFFTGDYGVHQSGDVPGYPASHGCVRIPAAFANEVYEFAGMGREVVIVA